MKKLLEFLTRSIVSHPQDIVVEESEGEEGINLNLQVHPDDIKIIIGKEGKTIRAIRELIKIKAIKERKKVNLNLINH